MKLEEKVISVFQSNTEGKRNIDLRTDLRKELGLDSFGTLMVINGLEDTFGISVEAGDFGRVKTVGDVVALLQNDYACA